MKKCFNYIFVGIFGLLIGSIIVFAATSYKKGVAAQHFEYLELFTKILWYVQNNYVEEVDSKKLIEGAIKGMLSELDPHTIYLPPDQYKEMQVDTSGKFGGLGIEITMENGYLTVVTPIEDTPAFNAGVEPGDRIVMIEDKAAKIKKDTKGMTLQDAVQLMRGKRGSKVTIHVLRKGNEKPIPIEIERDIIRVESVKFGLIEQDYGWLRITNFQTNTLKDVERGIEKMIRDNKKNLKGLVLDLRKNPGGLLEEAVAVAGLFVGKANIVSTIGRDKKTKDVEYSHPQKTYTDFKLAVLVDEYSASASEIVAGALQDHKRGVIVGKKTFGKGSVQTVIDLENEAGLKLTVARYYTPNGRSIQSQGIVPDIEVDRIDMSVIEKARKQKSIREADLKGHILGENEKPNTEEPNVEEEDVRPIKVKDGKKIRVADPKLMVKNDFQLQQALSYLKAWDIFAISTLSPTSHNRSVSNTEKK